MKRLICAALLATLAAPAMADPPTPAPAKGPTSADIIAQAPASDWRPLDPQNTLYLDLPAGRVVIELAPAFAPEHVANIRAMAHEGFYDGLPVERSQENYVVQWGDPDGKKPLGGARAHLPAEFERPYAADLQFTPLPDPDSYAAQAGFAGGFPAAREGGSIWPVHCYSMVGVGRDNPPDSGSGAELYVVIGQAPRHLDRNIAVVGRVVKGMELLSVMPRGTGALGFYDKPEQRTPITAIRLAADVPEAERVKLEVMRTDSASFHAYVEARRNRREAWFARPLGHVDVCNVPVPMRAAP